MDVYSWIENTFPGISPASSSTQEQTTEQARAEYERTLENRFGSTKGNPTNVVSEDLNNNKADYTITGQQSAGVGTPGKQYAKANVEANGVSTDTLSAQNNQQFSSLDTWRASLLDRAAQNPDFHVNDYLPGGSAALNINSKNAAETQRLSRLADAMNNQYFRSPRTGSTYQGGVRGQAVQGQAADLGSVYKRSLDTEETRQMERSRAYEAAMRNRQIGRQQDFADMPLEQDKQMFLQQARLAENLNDEQIRQLAALYDFEMGYYDLQRQQLFERDRIAYESYLTRIDVPKQQAQIVADYAIKNPEVGNAFAVLAGVAQGAPEATQVLWNKQLANTVYEATQAGLNEQQTLRAVQEEMMSNVGEISKALGVAPEVFQDAVQSIGSSWSGGN